jgi:SOS-response transcriptional repressor LexA
MLRFTARRVRVSVREAATAVGLRSSQTAYHHLKKLEEAGEGRRDLFRYDEEVTVKRLYTEGIMVRRRAEDMRVKLRVVYVVHQRGKKA